MATLVLEISETQKVKALKKIASEMGATIIPFTKNEEEDFKLGRIMKKSEKSGKGDLNKLLKHIGIE